jgi:hypothetical protein
VGGGDAGGCSWTFCEAGLGSGLETGAWGLMRGGLYLPEPEDAGFTGAEVDLEAVVLGLGGDEETAEEEREAGGGAEATAWRDGGVAGR